jgi:MFS family permease
MATSDIKPTSSCAENADTEKRAHVIDTTHTDEAMKVLLTYVGNREWDASEEAKVVRKIDLKLMPILCLTYGVQFYDKGLLSQAVGHLISLLGALSLTTILKQALFGIRQDLNLTSKDRYSFAASIFYLGFIAGCYPVIVMAQRFPLERVAFAIVSLWGGCMALTAACTDWRGLFVQRFFLGVLEAGVSPMFMMLVGGWYKKDEQAFRMG